jgi:hypothetical protein
LSVTLHVPRDRRVHVEPESERTVESAALRASADDDVHVTDDAA